MSKLVILLLCLNVMVFHCLILLILGCALFEIVDVWMSVLRVVVLGGDVLLGIVWMTIVWSVIFNKLDCKLTWISHHNSAVYQAQ